jgi:riboflavin kinase/FMN adenylyltransferase
LKLVARAFCPHKPENGLKARPLSDHTSTLAHMVKGTAITIGNFDGAHRGHAALVAAARESVGRHGRVIVMSFDPHPMTVLRPGSSPLRLSTFEQRSQYFKEHGADDVIALKPTREFLGQTPEQFIKTIVDEFQPLYIVEGDDFRFGKGRAGSVETLRLLQDRYGYTTITIDAVDATLSDCSIVRASSSMVRWLLERGRVRDAQRILARPYEIRAMVVCGDKRGRSIGVPTANLAHEDFVLPGDGIYSGAALLPDGRRFAAAISVGTKPTFGNSPRVCEAHLLNYDGPVDHYGWIISLQFADWLRDQVFFNDVEQLIAQLQRDIAVVAATMKYDAKPCAMAAGE